MGYLKIPNLYKDKQVLLFRECYAMEKIHGTSASIIYTPGEPLAFFSGGASLAVFKALFNEEALSEALAERGVALTIFGEAYGGNMQRMSKVYGDHLKFVVFDVRLKEGGWLDVPTAEKVATDLELEFVPYWRVRTDIDALDSYRDKPSTLGHRNGVSSDTPGEGIVIRPLIEVCSGNTRIIAKHKSGAFKETRTARPVKERSPEELEVLRDAQAIADEWVTPMRLEHVLDKLPGAGMEQTKDVIAAMVEDVSVEAGSEIAMSRAAKKAISKLTVKLFKQHLQMDLHPNEE